MAHIVLWAMSGENRHTAIPAKPRGKTLLDHASDELAKRYPNADAWGFISISHVVTVPDGVKGIRIKHNRGGP